jgi:hypothetical protein
MLPILKSWTAGVLVSALLVLSAAPAQADTGTTAGGPNQPAQTHA